MGEAWIALAGTLLGGAGFKIVEHILGRTKRKDDTTTSIRSELRAEVTELRAEADRLRDETDALRKEIDVWRKKYYSLVSSIAKGDIEGAQRKITE